VARGPKSLDSGGGVFSLSALLIEALLLGVFAIEHSVMARQFGDTYRHYRQRTPMLLPSTRR